METQHTPGPWRVVYYDAGDTDHYDFGGGPCPSIQAPDDQDTAIVHWDGFKQRYWVSANGDQRQIEANARLIAAAPELLSALKKALASVEQPTGIGLSIGGLEWRWPEWVTEARAAIAKATDPLT